MNLDGEDLRNLPLAQRQKRLQSEFRATDFFHIPGALKGELSLLISKIEEFGFEGVIAKKKDSIYEPGKIPGTWIKMKLKQSEEFIIGGFVPGRYGLDQLVVGRFAGKDLMFVEAVDDGFVPATRKKVYEAVKKLVVKECPFANLPEKRGAHRMDREKMKTVVWVKPKVVVEIAMNEWTPSKHLRHAEFRRLRADKSVGEIEEYPSG